MTIASERLRLTPLQRRQLLASPAGWLATGFGSGLAPVAQGTVGSAVALLPWLWLRHCDVPTYLLVLLLGCVIGCWACAVAGRLLGVDDHRALVWDEFIGQWLALLPVLHHPGWLWPVLGFGLFRLFDAGKPWPVRWLDRTLKGGVGVMLDDVAAGAMAALVLWALLHWLG
ncbi:phosphatidylglycerophosphatase A family protein [Frateuria aurantia]